MDGWTHEWITEHMHTCMNERIDECIGEGLNGRMNACMDGFMHERRKYLMTKCINGRTH